MWISLVVQGFHRICYLHHNMCLFICGYQVYIHNTPTTHNPHLFLCYISERPSVCLNPLYRVVFFYDKCEMPKFGKFKCCKSDDKEMEKKLKSQHHFFSSHCERWVLAIEFSVQKISCVYTCLNHLLQIQPNKV